MGDLTSNGGNTLDFVYTFPARDPMGPWGHYGMWVLLVVAIGAIPLINSVLDHPGKRVKAIFKGLVLVAIISFFPHAWTYHPDYLEEIRISEGAMSARPPHLRNRDLVFA
jgi:hypothetical protein